MVLDNEILKKAYQALRKSFSIFSTNFWLKWVDLYCEIENDFLLKILTKYLTKNPKNFIKIGDFF